MARVFELIELADAEALPSLGSLMALGANHEQQHQELLMTDLKYNLSVNPLRPAYRERQLPESEPRPLGWVEFEPGLRMIGHDRRGFAFDNEWPRHNTYVGPFRLATRLATNGEYLEFMDSGGYDRSNLWLSEGWKIVQERRWSAPLYWEEVNGRWSVQTLSGAVPADENAPVVHVSYFEADAFARWAQKRLPTEQEWETAAEGTPLEGNLQESGVYQPLAAPHGENGLQQLTGDVWEWTQSPYAPYPGFRPLEGDLGEYNGKFMVNQMVLRGATAASPTASPSPSVTLSPTRTVTPLPTPSATPLPTASATPVPTASATPLPSATATPLPLATATPLPTATATPLPTATATSLPTATATPLPTAAATPLPTATATPLPTAAATPLPTATATPPPTATATQFPTATATRFPTATATRFPTATSTPFPTPTSSP